jgi:predicted DNA-binding helix-hairpin-helix protein
MDLRAAGAIEGLFLTSGLATRPVHIMDRMLATVDMLRASGFGKYIHLKLLPGADAGQVAEAMRLADRVSVNLEAPTQGALQRMAPEKNLVRDLTPHIKTVTDLSRRFPERRPRAGLVTQFVIGPGGETDSKILNATSRLYAAYGVRRVYFSGFIPVMGTPMEHEPATSPLREARLYQADWLLRFYGFQAHELVVNERGMLPTSLDPKTVWALANPSLFPLEINRAPRELLLRVPGLGPQSVNRVLHMRRASPFREPADVARIGAVMKRAQGFLLFMGRHFPAPPPREDPVQLKLFEESFAFGRPLDDGRRIQPARGGTYL